MSPASASVASRLQRVARCRGDVIGTFSIPGSKNAADKARSMPVVRTSRESASQHQRGQGDRTESVSAIGSEKGRSSCWLVMHALLASWAETDGVSAIFLIGP